MTTRLAPQVPSKIPSLDGLRASAILLVLVGHYGSTHNAPAFLDHQIFLSLGNVGVRVFFVISGFLITTLLLRELDEMGRIDLRAFYVRRALRIFPASFAYIGIIYLLYLGGVVDLTLKLGSRTHSSPYPDLVHAITYTANYTHDYNWYLNHLWSLSVEEQFYLLWPGLLVVCGVQWGVRGCLLTLIVVPLIRASMHLLGAPSIALSREFQAVADALATGCLLSLLHNRFSAATLGRFLRHPAALVMGVLGMGVGYGVAFLSPPFAHVFGQTAANLGTALVVTYGIRDPAGPLGSLLNWRPMMFIGVLSYSLYLWQQPFLFFKSTSWMASSPQNIVFAFGAALLSYYGIERPFLRRKARYAASAPRSSSDRPSSTETGRGAGGRGVDGLNG